MDKLWNDSTDLQRFQLWNVLTIMAFGERGLTWAEFVKKYNLAVNNYPHILEKIE
jgi:hypothetical protein